MLWLTLVAHAGSTSPDLDSAVTAVLEARDLRIAPGAPTIPREDYLRAADEVVTGLERVDGVSAAKGYGVAVVDVPIDRLWAAISDDVGHPDIVNDLKYTELLAGQECHTGRTILQALSLPVISDRWWIVTIQHNAVLDAATKGRVREQAWTSSTSPSLVHSEAGRAVVRADTPVGFTKGAWVLAEVDGDHTLVEYYVWTDPGGRIPGGLANAFAAGGIRDTMDAMTELARRGSRCD